MQSKTLMEQNTKLNDPQQGDIVRSFFLTEKWVKNPPQVPQPSTQPKCHGRTSSAPHNLVRWRANTRALQAEAYTSVYQNDFRVWKINRRQPFRPRDNLNVSQQLSVKNSNVSEGGAFKKKSAHDPKPDPKVREPPKFESTTSYRSDYVAHPVQPRTRTKKPVNPPNNILPTEPNVARDVNQKLSDNSGNLFEQFKSWLMRTMSPSQGKGKDSTPAKDQEKYMSTTHEDFKAHRCERTKPCPPLLQNLEKSTEPFHNTTTMKEDFKFWNVPRRPPIIPKKSNLSLCHEPFNPRPEVSKTLCDSTCNITQQLQSPAENGFISVFECTSNSKEKSRTYWATAVNRGATWAKSEVCEEPRK